MKLLIGSAGGKQLPAAVPAAAAAADVAAVAAVAAAAAAVPAPAEPAVPAAGVSAAAGVAAAVEIAAAAAASTARHGDLVWGFAALLPVVVGAFVLVGKPAAADGWWQWQRQHHCTGQTCPPC